MPKISVNLVGPSHWRPFIKLFRMFGGWMFAFGPVVIQWFPEEKPILVHHWKAIGYYGAGTISTSVPMNERNAIAWASEFGEIAYIDRETGFIFYRPKK